MTKRKNKAKAKPKAKRTKPRMPAVLRRIAQMHANQTGRAVRVQSPTGELLGTIQPQRRNPVYPPGVRISRKGKWFSVRAPRPAKKRR